MATSLHACYPNSCKNQHQMQQMKAVPKSPNVVRRSASTRQYNTANRRSAVERLEESKANYVKSERVLDSKQEFKNSSHLRISTGSHLDAMYKTAGSTGCKPPHSPDEQPVQVSYLRVQTECQSPPPPVRTRAKSQSEHRDTLTRKHSFASQGKGRRRRIEVLIDIETQLRQLITTGSRENVSLTPSHAKPQPETSFRVKTQPEILSSIPFHPTENMSRMSGYVKTQPETQFHVKETMSRMSGYVKTQPENLSSTPFQTDIMSRMSGYIKSQPDIMSMTPVHGKTQPPEIVTKVRRGYSDPVRKSCWMPPDLSPDDSFVHKSMPDLSPSPQKPCLSLSSNVSTKELVPRVVPKDRTNMNDEDGFDAMCREPRRFSNGTGMLHLTPYYSASSLLQRKPVSRSKSDVSHRYSKQGSEYHPRRTSNYTTAEIERFFSTMGLDTSAWHHVTSPSSVSSPPCFFESVSSVDSNDEKNSESSEESLPVVKEGLRNHDLRIHGPLETSIVEKNARVIKWLYNCRKAASCES